MSKNLHKIDILDSLEKLQEVKSIIKEPFIIESIKTRKQTHFPLEYKNNKLVFINFWASYCKPCIEEFKIFEKIISKYNNKIQFYYVSIEDSLKTNEFISKNKTSLEFYKIIKTSRYTNTQILPLSYVISNDTILKTYAGVQNWDSIFLNLIKQ